MRSAVSFFARGNGVFTPVTAGETPQACRKPQCPGPEHKSGLCGAHYAAHKERERRRHKERKAVQS